MKTRTDLLKAPDGLAVVQLTEEAACPASHVYMEAQIFLPDSQRFVLHRSATPHGSRRNDPEHRYLLCDLDNHCRLTPLTDELGATGPAVSPDGRYFYYFVNETALNAGRLILKRMTLADRRKETVLTLDAPRPETGTRPSEIYPLATISSDGAKLAIAAFFGDGEREATFGLMVFDLEKASVAVIVQGPTWCNMHPQFSRSPRPEFKRDILIQENHDYLHDRFGRKTSVQWQKGADIHVVRDDGSDFRALPWGRDGHEFVSGHQAWRGHSAWAIASNSAGRLLEGLPAADQGHLGLNTAGARRNDLSRAFKTPRFDHFATDRAGELLVTDYAGGSIYLGRMQTPGEAPIVNWTYLLNARSSCVKETQVHPFLSPDGSKAFFNSDESGILQAYMITGLENLRI
jgi:hypothetical protein